TLPADGARPPRTFAPPLNGSYTSSIRPRVRAGEFLAKSDVRLTQARGRERRRRPAVQAPCNRLDRRCRGALREGREQRALPPHGFGNPRIVRNMTEEFRRALQESAGGCRQGFGNAPAFGGVQRHVDQELRYARRC